MSNNVSYKGKTVELEIKDMLYPGVGIGFWENRPVLVKNTYPNEQVEVLLYKKTKQGIEAKLKQLLKPSERRQTPNCKHFGICGGCQSLDLAYSDQIDLKQTILASLLKEESPSLLPCLKPIIPSQTSEYYRNKMDFSFGLSDDGRVILGLKQRGFFDKVVELDMCIVQDQQTISILKTTQTFFNEKKCTTWDYRAKTGLLRHLVLRQSKFTGQFLAILVVSEDHPDLYQEFSQALVQQVPNIQTVLYGINSTISDTSFVADLHLLYGQSYLEESLCDLKFRFSPQAFFQTNSQQANTLYQTIFDAADVTQNDTVLDLYCGTGTIGMTVAKKAGRVIGVDENDFSVQNAKLNADLNNITNITFETGNVRVFLKTFKDPVSIVIVDPPRDGLIPKALKRVGELQAKRIIYVSCNFSTFIRDIKELKYHGYQLESIQPVDMFPNTWHSETVSVLTLTQRLN